MLNAINAMLLDIRGHIHRRLVHAGYQNIADDLTLGLISDPLGQELHFSL